MYDCVHTPFMENNISPSRKLIYRTQLQVDVSPYIKKRLKQIAADEGVTLKEVVLKAIAHKYPKLEGAVKETLGEPLS
jgi:DNA polymerase III delta prime subunit